MNISSHIPILETDYMFYYSEDLTMPSNERDGSRDRDLVVRNHQHSLSEINRSSIPMYVNRDV